MARFTTERGLDRLVNFSDATVAIALTLLVLPLTDLAADAHGVTAGRLITEHWADIVAFLVSFAVIVGVWREHHGLFESLVDYAPALTLINFVWLFAVVALPFSTEVNQEAPSQDRGALALYIGNLLLAFAAIAAMRVAALRDPSVINPERRDAFGLASSLVLAGLCAVALLVALIFPAVGMWALLLLIPTGSVTRLLHRTRRTR